MATVPKPDPKMYYICIESYVSDRGVRRSGERLRGDHPDVQAVPIWWVPETLDTDQRHAERQARMLIAYPIKDGAA